MSNMPKPQEIYRHFKGNLYQITAIAEHSETKEQLVVYQALYGDYSFYARPLSMFMEMVDLKKYPNATQKYRFELVDIQNLEKQEPVQMNTSNSVEQINVSNPIEQMNVSKSVDLMDDVTTVLGEKIVLDMEDDNDFTVDEALDVKPDVSGQEITLDPLLVEFLDADTYEERLNILTGLHHKITNDMLTTMAVACDIELKDGELEDKYNELKNCLLTLERFECNRLR